MQPRTQPHRNHAQPHAGHELDSDHLDPIPQPDWPAQRPTTRKEPTMTATATIDWTRLHADLSTPFPEGDIRYRAGTTNRDKTKAQALPYVDPRAYEDRLNAIVPGSWEVTFEPWGEHRIICRLTIHGVTRSSTGEATDSPDGIAGTSAEAQAFKRACAKFGLGRHLYALTPRWTDYDAANRALVETPKAPERQANTSAQPTHPTPTVAGIGRYRAVAMASQLERAGIPKAQQVGFAGRTLKRFVHDLAHLTDDEARAVWLAAQTAQRAGGTTRAPVARTPERGSARREPRAWR
jgi:hypothetical protein